VTVISHSVLTNHRIVAEAEEPFPEVAFHMTTPQLPDLVQLSADPAGQNAPPPLTLLQAYAQVLGAHPEYRARYWSVAEQLKATQPGNVQVLEALADQAAQNKTAEGTALAIQCLKDATLHGATNPADFDELAELLVASNRQAEAVNVLRQGMQLAPYDAELYRLGATLYFALNRMQEACEVAAKGRQRLPQDDAIRSLMKRCDSAPLGMSK
jgi:tetratricopeptide (TPR) repeat protein